MLKYGLELFIIQILVLINNKYLLYIVLITKFESYNFNHLHIFFISH